MNKTRMRALSLFSGIGGFELAATALNCFKVQQLVEIDEDAHHVLRQHYPHIPIHRDIRTFSATPGQYDCIWGGVSPAQVRAMPGSEGDWLIQNQVCGGKCSELSSKPDPALLLSKIQKACSPEEVEKSLPLSEWQDIVSKSHSSYRQRKLGLGTKETKFLSSLSFRTLPSSRGTNSNPAGLTKCEQSLRKLRIISPSHYLSTRGLGDAQIRVIFPHKNSFPPRLMEWSSSIFLKKIGEGKGDNSDRFPVR